MDQPPTKTLAEIYLEQGHLQEAYEIYRTLSERDPSDPEISRRLKELNKKLNLSRSFSLPLPIPRSREEKIRYLERWLARLRERKKE